MAGWDLAVEMSKAISRSPARGYPKPDWRYGSGSILYAELNNAITPARHSLQDAVLEVGSVEWRG